MEFGHCAFLQMWCYWGKRKQVVCTDTEFQCSPDVWAQLSLPYKQSWGGIPGCIPPLWARLPVGAWLKCLTSQELAPKGWSKLGKQPVPQGDRIQMLGVISPGVQGTRSYWPGSKPSASFFLLLFLVAFSTRLFLTGSGVIWLDLDRNLTWYLELSPQLLRNNLQKSLLLINGWRCCIPLLVLLFLSFFVSFYIMCTFMHAYIYICKQNPHLPGWMMGCLWLQQESCTLTKTHL